ncbi:MAG: ABC transporter permease subunit [Treponema sp.]|nr:ABC transporter permease subunit [Treponema sp.]
MRKNNSGMEILWKKLVRDKYLILMIVPAFIYYILFKYVPMGGLIMAFKNYSPGRGIFGSPWVGFKWFSEFFSSMYFGRTFRNTLLLSLYELIFGFPVPIIFALLLNEIRTLKFKKLIQTLSYYPHFISIVIVIGIMNDLFSANTATMGLVNRLLEFSGVSPIAFMADPKWFRTLYVGSGIWQGLGWGSIIYLAALAGIDQEMYEAANIDGAGRFKQLWYITLPCLIPTIIILLILRMGRVMNVGFEKVFLMYTPLTYETADVISTYVYRRGIVDAQYGYGAAVGLFNSVINFILVISVNQISRRISETSLW